METLASQPELTPVFFTCSVYRIWPLWCSAMCGIKTAEQMSSKGLSTILLQGKCPRCHKGDIFTFPITSIIRFSTMNTACPVCGVRFEPEPGFYQGAMFVGYAISVVCIVILSLLLFFLGNPGQWVYIGVISFFMLLLAPFNYRYSRILYLHFFGGIHYDHHQRH